jgi:hypothetical protein
MLIESATPLCQKRLTLKLPRHGVDYIQIGLSGRNQSPVINRKGVISSDDFQNNKGCMLGSAGSSPGDSGAGIFHVSSLTLYGIGTAAMKKVNTDFTKATGEEIGNALNDMSLVASQPVLSFICPSNLFTGKSEPPYKRTKSEELDFQCSAY